jgi:hypothetical protein
MRLITLTCLAGVLAIGFGGGVAQAATQGVKLPPDKCKAVWQMASPNGETLSKDKAVNYVVNFTMVDTNKDAAIDADEFNKACDAGLIKPDVATTKDIE